MMRPAAATPGVLALAALLSGLVHCDPVDVVVATLPAHRDGGGPHKCAADDDCHGDEFCTRDECDDVTGHCEHPPLFCDAVRAPTCGCDGLSYWNDCLRKLAHVTASTQGECVENEVACQGPHTCPAGASCARIVASGDRCASASAGTCWVLPPSCPPDDGPRFSRCADPDSCVNACDAIRTEEPHRPLPSATCPP